MRRARFVFGLCLVAGCTPPPAPSFVFDVRAESDPGVPLAQVELVRDGVQLAATSAEGKATLTLTGTPGESVQLDVRCPATFRAPEKPLSVVLRPQAQGSAKPEYHVACKPELRSLVVTVRAENGPGLPVRYLGRELARTDADGAAHVLLRVPAGENLTLELDTSEAPNRALSPESPRMTLVMPDHDEVALFDQAFTRPTPKAKRAPAPTGPVRIR